MESFPKYVKNDMNADKVKQEISNQVEQWQNKIDEEVGNKQKDFIVQKTKTKLSEIMDNSSFSKDPQIIKDEVDKFINDNYYKNYKISESSKEKIKYEVDQLIQSEFEKYITNTYDFDQMVSANCKGNKKIKSIEIPNGTSVIERYAFEGCLSLERVIIPVSVIRIEYGAFQNCYSLVNIIIPGSVIEIGDWAFCGCSKLEKIEIKGEVINIGYSAFYKCMRLKDIIVPNGFDLNKLTIGSSSFCGCTSLNDMIKSKIEELNPNALKTQSNYCCYNYLQGIK